MLVPTVSRLLQPPGFPKAAGVKPPTNCPTSLRRCRCRSVASAAWGWHRPGCQEQGYPAAAGVEAFTVSRFASHRITTEQTRNDGRQR